MSGNGSPDRPARAASWLGAPAALVYCTVALELHEAAGSPNGAPALVAIIADYLFLSSAALWLLRHARRSGRDLPYDCASFLFLGFPVVPMIYLLMRYRVRGLGIIGGAFLLVAAGVIAVRLPIAITQL